MIKFFLRFVLMGFFSFGGGYTFMSLMEDQLVKSTGWLDQKELLLALTAGQITPGPVAVAGSFAGFLIGYKWTGSLWGGLGYALLAWVGTNVATILCMGAIMRFYQKVADHPFAPHAMTFVMPAVIGLIFYLAGRIATSNDLTGWPQLVIGAVAFCLAAFSGIDYVFIIIGGGVIGYFLMHMV